MLIAEAAPAGVSTIDYLIHFENVTGYGGAFIYDQRVASNTNDPSNFTFQNISIEDSANSVFTLASTGGHPSRVEAISLVHARLEDSQASTPVGVLELRNSMAVSGAQIINSYGGLAVLQNGGGSVDSVQVQGCAINCSIVSEDTSGNLIGGVSITNGGLDVQEHSGNNRIMPWLRSDPLGEYAFAASQGGPAFRATAAGSHFSTIAADPTMGYLFGDGASYGYTARLLQSTPNTLDVGFSNMSPPTGITATPTTGGTLAPGTYYYYVVSVGGSSCDPTVNQASTMSLASNVAVVAAPNNAVSITWTPPPTSLVGIAHYCVIQTATSGVARIHSFHRAAFRFLLHLSTLERTP